MSYTCPDCEDGILEAKVRELDLELKDGESAHIVGGVVVITSVGCNNGCSADDEEEEEKPKRKKRTPATVDVRGEMCPVDECTREAGHRGLHNHKGKVEEEAAGVQRCTRSDLCALPYAHTGACNKKRQAEE